MRDRNREGFSRLLRRAAFAFAGLAATFAVAALTLAGAVAAWRADLPPPLKAAEALRQANGGGRVDVVIFYAGSVEGTLAVAGPVLAVAREGRIDHVLIAGGARPERGFYGSEAVLETLRARSGLDLARWTAERRSYDTLSNLAAARDWLSTAEPPSVLLLASDSYHLYRIRTFIDRILPPKVLARVVWLPAEARDRSLPHRLWRLTWEIGAWSAELLPEPLRRAAVAATRE